MTQFDGHSQVLITQKSWQQKEEAQTKGKPFGCFVAVFRNQLSRIAGTIVREPVSEFILLDRKIEKGK